MSTTSPSPAKRPTIRRARIYTPPASREGLGEGMLPTKQARPMRQRLVTERPGFPHPLPQAGGGEVTPSARVQAAIEILDLVIASARDEGPPADAIVQAYFKTRRYAGSKDRRAVRELVFRAIRRSGEPPASGRVAMIGLAGDDEEVAAAFDGSPHAPPRIGSREKGSEISRCSRNGSSMNCRPWSRLTNGRHCSTAPRSTFASTLRGRRAKRWSKRLKGPNRRRSVHGDLRLPPDSRVDRASRLHRGPCRSAGRRQPVDRAGVRGTGWPADRRSLRRRRRQIARAGRSGGREGGNHRLRHQPRTPEQASRPSPPRRSEDRDAAAQCAARGRGIARSPGKRRCRPGRCAMLGQRDLAPQSRRALAADARPARPSDRAAAARARSRCAPGKAWRDGWFMRSARCLRAKGRIKLPAS